MKDTIKIFVSYSKKDRDKGYLFKDGGLLDYLKLSLEKDGVQFWMDQMLITADDWDSEIQKQIQEAHIALVFVSQWFLSTPYCQNKEIKEFLEKSRKDGLVIFPIIVSPCEWEDYEWLKSRQFVPSEGKSISLNYKDKGKRENLFLKILKDLKLQIEHIRASSNTDSDLEDIGARRHLPHEEIFPVETKYDSVEAKKTLPLIQTGLSELIQQASYSSIIGVSNDKYWLFTFLANRILHLWAINDFSRHIVLEPKNLNGAPSSCAMRKKNDKWELLLGLDNEIEYWHIFGNGHTEYLEQTNFKTSFKNLTQIKFSFDARRLLISYLEGVDVWDIDSGQHLRHFSTSEQICASSFYNNDQFVVAGSKNGAILLWNIVTGSLVGDAQSHSGFPVSAIIDSSTSFMSAGEDGTLVIYGNNERIKKLKTIQVNAAIQCADFDRVSGLIYVGLNNKTVIARNPISSSNNWEVALPDVPTSLTRINDNCLAVATEGRTIEILDIKKVQRIATLIGFRSNKWVVIFSDGNLFGEGYEQFLVERS